MEYLLDDIDEYLIDNTVARIGSTINSDVIHKVLPIKYVSNLVGSISEEEDIYYEVDLTLAKLKNGLYLLLDHDLILPPEELLPLLRIFISSSDPLFLMADDMKLHNILELAKLGH